MLTVLSFLMILMILVMEISISHTTIKSGDKYTVEWWKEQANLGSVGRACGRLYRLHQQGVVEKVAKNKNEIIRFIPVSDFNDNEIIAKLQFLGGGK